MNWNEVAEHRRKVYRTLCQAQQLAVQSGDRIAVLTLGDRIKFHRSRLYYAIDKAGKAAKSPRDKKKSKIEAPASCHPPHSDKHGRSQHRPSHRACRGPLHHGRRRPQRRIPALRQSARYARSTSWHFAATAALRPTRISAVRGASSARCLR